MFSDNKDMTDVLFVREVGTDLYLMIKKSHGPLPKKYEAVKSFQDVPNSMVKLLSMPRPLNENFNIIFSEKVNASKYEEKLSDYEDCIKELLDETDRI
jgi:hypothetical protein